MDLQKSYVVDESDDDMDEVEEPPHQPVYEEEEAEIVESDVELEGETVEPDNDPPQKVSNSTTLPFLILICYFLFYFLVKIYGCLLL